MGPPAGRRGPLGVLESLVSVRQVQPEQRIERLVADLELAAMAAGDGEPLLVFGEVVGGRRANGTLHGGRPVSGARGAASDL